MCWPRPRSCARSAAIPGPSRRPTASTLVCERLILETLLPGAAPPAGETDPAIAPLLGPLPPPAPPRRMTSPSSRASRACRPPRCAAAGLPPRAPRRAATCSTCGCRTAQRLLAETSLPVGEVAAQAGFQDMFYFSRRFKLETGLAPTQYRRRYRLG
ncbi:MAG: helix-turn-helix domain-containing protein [Verrucomicrobiota bacterium]